MIKKSSTDVSGTTAVAETECEKMTKGTSGRGSSGVRVGTGVYWDFRRKKVYTSGSWRIGDSP